METPTSQNPQLNSLIERAKAIILQPVATWAVIDTEVTPHKSLFMGYALPLAAIGPIASAIGSSFFGFNFFGISSHMGIMPAVQTAAVSFIMALISVYILAFIINEMASNFGGEKNFDQAFKVAAYGSTAAWLSGIFSILPALGFLGILGLYSLYLLYLGLPVLMKAPQEKSLGYTVVVIIVSIVLSLIAGSVVGGVVGASRLGGLAIGAAQDGIFSKGNNDVNINIPGVANIDTAKIEEATKKMEEAAKAMETGKSSVTPIATDDLKALLPAAIMGGAKENESVSSGGTEGMNIATASADYRIGDGTVSVTVSDLSSMAGLGAMASALNVNTSSSSNGSYSKVTSKDGQMITEDYDSHSKSGEYSVVLDGRVVISAKGNNVDIATIKAAAAAVDAGKAKSLIK